MSPPWPMAGFLLGAAGMFATMYGTQAVLPEIARDFAISPARAGLTISVVVVAIAAGGWLWGPVSDRIGRKRAITLACLMLSAPTVASGLAPGFGWLIGMRALQGLCMPGLLTVGVPYVAEVFAPALGGRAMGWYMAALVAGGLIGRVGVGLITELAGWRLGLSALAVLPLAGAAVMMRWLPDVPAPGRTHSRRRAAALHLRNPRLLQATVAGSGLYFAFVGIFSYIAFRLQAPPFGLGTASTSAIFALWACGAVGPAAGRLADGIGWRRVAGAGAALGLAGCALSLSGWLPAVVLGLAMVTTGMFGGVTGAQLGLGGAADVDRGVASALYFTAYYLAGALAAFVPGLAWSSWGWPGVAAIGASALGIGLAALTIWR